MRQFGMSLCPMHLCPDVLLCIVFSLLGSKLTVESMSTGVSTPAFEVCVGVILARRTINFSATCHAKPHRPGV